jgi:RHS repeat-associated protein
VLNRLTWDTGVSSGNPTYSYDANGNRLTRAATVAGFTAQTLSYVASRNRLASFNGTSVAYDGMGNLLTGVGAATFSYGVNGRLGQLDVGSGANDLYLLYNGLGELARTRLTTRDAKRNIVETNREYYQFAADGRALELVQESATRVQWDWIWLDNLPVLQFQDSYNAQGALTGTQLSYLHPDHLGTPRIATNTSGAIAWRYRSDGFGTASLSGSAVVRLRLPGQVDLGFQGVNYNYFRDYDPGTGRYLESDPIGLNGGPNTYGYALQNPLKYSDEAGLASVLQFICRQSGIPTEAESCVEQNECFTKARDQIASCQAKGNVYQRFLCIRCWETYAATCPGKSADSSCRRVASCAGAVDRRRGPG